MAVAAIGNVPAARFAAKAGSVTKSLVFDQPSASVPITPPPAFLYACLARSWLNC